MARRRRSRKTNSWEDSRVDDIPSIRQPKTISARKDKRNSRIDDIPSIRQPKTISLKEDKKEKKGKNGGILFDNVMIEGNDLGIFLYIGGWVIVGIFFTFSTNSNIKDLLTFYLPYEIMAIAYMALQFSYFHQEYSADPILNAVDTTIPKLNAAGKYKFLQIKYLNKREFGVAAIYIFLFIGLMSIINFIVNGIIVPYLGQIDFINEYNIGSFLVFQVSRTVLIEEMVFRGLFISVTVIGLKRIVKISRFEGQEILFLNRKLKKDELYIAFIALIAIIFSSIVFGYIHIYAYENFVPVITLSILGIFCGILAVKYGLWSAIVLHLINNLIAAFSMDKSMFSGDFSMLTGVLNWTILIMMILFFIALGILYVVVKRLNDDLLVFNYVAISFIVFFIIGYYTNGLIQSEYFNNLIYFEHFHLILLLPLFYFIFRNRIAHKKLYSIISGCFIGFFISDLLDIIILTPIQIVLTIVYVLIATFIYIATYFYLKKKKNKVNVFTLSTS